MQKMSSGAIERDDVLYGIPNTYNINDDRKDDLLYGFLMFGPIGASGGSNLKDDREKIIEELSSRFASASTEDLKKLRDFWNRGELMRSNARSTWPEAEPYSFKGELRKVPDKAPKLWNNVRSMYDTIVEFIEANYELGYGMTRPVLGRLDGPALKALQHWEAKNQLRWSALPTEIEHNDVLINWIKDNPDLAAEQIPATEIRRLSRVASTRRSRAPAP